MEFWFLASLILLTFLMAIISKSLEARLLRRGVKQKYALFANYTLLFEVVTAFVFVYDLLRGYFKTKNSVLAAAIYFLAALFFAVLSTAGELWSLSRQKKNKEK